jgi:hypothetical protein
MPYGPCLGKMPTKGMILAPPVRESFQLSRLPEQICQGATPDPTAVSVGDRESPVGVVSRTANDHG